MVIVAGMACIGVRAQAAVTGAGRPAAGTITTVAGGPGGPGPARGVGVSVCGVKFVRGALYLGGEGMVRRVDPRTDVLTTPVADWTNLTFNAIFGNYRPCGVTVDAAGNVLAANGTQVQVAAARSGRFYGRRMTAGHTYVIVDRSGAGRADGTPDGDGGPATAARLALAIDVELDPAGNVIVTDQGVGAPREGSSIGALVRVVAERTGRFYGRRMTAGDIYTVAGETYDSATSSTLATRTWLGLYIGVVRTDRSGNLLVTSGYNYVEPDISKVAAVRVVAVRTGRFYGRQMTGGHIYTIAGGGTNFAGDGGPATKAELACAAGVALDHDGNVIIADCGQVRVVAERSARFYGRRMTAGDIYAIAGYGGDRGNGVPAGRAIVYAIGVTVDSAGNVVVAQTSQVRLIAARTGRFYGQRMRAGYIYAIAGAPDGFGISGDGGPATRAEIGPYAVAEDRAGDLAIANRNMGEVRFVPATSGTFFGQKMTKGTIYTLARNGYDPYAQGQFSVAFDKAGNVLTAGPSLQVVAAVNGTFYGQPMTTGHVYTIPNGGGTGIAVDSHGNVLAADETYNKVWVLAATSGTFYGQPMTAGQAYVIAGNGQPGETGDGGPATAARLLDPVSVVADHRGNVLIAVNGRVRVVAAVSGTFFGRRMIAGDIYSVGRGMYSAGLAVDAAGNVLSAGLLGRYGSVVQLIAARNGVFYGVHVTTGHVYTIAGNSARSGYSGDGGPAIRALLNGPSGVAVSPSGYLLIADGQNLRVRSVAP